MSSLPLLLYTCAPNGEYNTVKLEPVQRDQTTAQITVLIDFFKEYLGSITHFFPDLFMNTELFPRTYDTDFYPGRKGHNHSLVLNTLAIKYIDIYVLLQFLNVAIVFKTL